MKALKCSILKKTSLLIIFVHSFLYSDAGEQKVLIDSKKLLKVQSQEMEKSLEQADFLNSNKKVGSQTSKNFSKKQNTPNRGPASVPAIEGKADLNEFETQVNGTPSW